VANVAEVLARELRWRTGTETAVFDQTRDLRSGGPDLIDRLVSATFGTMAIDAALERVSGAMTALVNGTYDLVPIPDPKVGPRRVEVAAMYDAERYLPRSPSRRGSPIFHARAAPPLARVGV
jgi:6-phosphofructokinase 1